MSKAIDEVLEHEPARRRQVEDKARVLFAERRTAAFTRADKLFSWLMAGQWVFAVLAAWLLSPYAWEGKMKSVHLHVQAAVFLGAAISIFPIVLARLRPGQPLTRHVIAAAQMLWSALLIHLTGGRIETHFHVFGSLAFLAFYLDWKVLATATVFVAGDHFIRGLVWPESVYGVTNPEWWRFLEHAGWVLFENAILVLWCVNGVKELRDASEKQAQVEVLSEAVRDRMAALEMALAERKGRP